jgi:hypothetical protein
MTTIRDLVEGGYLVEGDRLIWRRKSLKLVHIAVVTSSGILNTEDGQGHKSPSGAAKHLGKQPIDGWLAWKLEGSGETLAELRKRYLSAK